MQNNLKYNYIDNIYIPTKGRSEKCVTARHFNDHLVSVNLVVEPQDWHNYYKNFKDLHNIIVLPSDDLGICYVRNWIKKYEEEKNAYGQYHKGWYWMIDDDVTFKKIANKKTVDVDNFYFFEEIENSCLPDKVAQVSFEYQQFAWSQEKNATDNSYCDVAVGINTLKTRGIYYDDSLLLKEDRDFTMQIIQSGYKTRRFNNIAISCPTNGSNIGGLFDVYRQNGIEIEACEQMVQKWGKSICNIQIKPSGRTDLKIHWKNISSGQQSLFF